MSALRSLSSVALSSASAGSSLPESDPSPKYVPIGGRIDPDGSWQAGDYGRILGEVAPFSPTFSREDEERQEQEFTTKLILKSGVSWS